jgi:hypothetical protein
MRKRYTPGQQRDINLVRLFIQALTLSDPPTPDSYAIREKFPSQTPQARDQQNHDVLMSVTVSQYYLLCLNAGYGKRLYHQLIFTIDQMPFTTGHQPHGQFNSDL